MRLSLLLLLCCCIWPAHARFVVQKAHLESATYREMAADMTRQRVLQGIAESMNEVIELPVKVSLRFAECGEANAYYDPEKRLVTLCFELIESAYESVRSKRQSQERLDDAAASVLVFYLFHEIGHALIDVFDIPITGREEDAADQLSAWLLIDSDDGNSTALDVATSLDFDAQSDDTDDQSLFADEHSLSKQRYFNMLCWVYGSDPDAHADLVSDEKLPQARADQCEAEYQRLDRSWTALLSDYIRQDAQ